MNGGIGGCWQVPDLTLHHTSIVMRIPDIQVGQTNL